MILKAPPQFGQCSMSMSIFPEQSGGLCSALSATQGEVDMTARYRILFAQNRHRRARVMASVYVFLKYANFKNSN
jgi:hypothetical protein